jgi:hypothetical protein
MSNSIEIEVRSDMLMNDVSFVLRRESDQKVFRTVK